MVGNLDDEGSRREFLEFVAQFDTPAFIRRARRTEEAATQIIAFCRDRRNVLMEISQMRLATVGALVAYDWPALGEYLQDGNPTDYLDSLHDEWKPQLRVRIQVADSPRKIRRALRDLATSFENFNRKWGLFTRGLDLTDVNQAREDYNNYYVCEKACAFDSEEIGRQGFQELPPFTLDDVIKELPYLHVPAIR